MAILQNETETENKKAAVPSYHHIDVKDMKHFHWMESVRKVRALSAGMWTISIFVEEKGYNLMIEGISVSMKTSEWDPSCRTDTP